ncbi:MAG: alpha/beta hydrolase [Alphaproteobacteria bacterium]
MQQKHFLGLTAAGFHKVAYTEWGPADDPCPVVCVHGLTRNGRDFDALAGRLAAAGRRVVCPDVVGRGRSMWLTDPAGYGYPQYCADMAALIARLDVEAVDWVGTSMGGLIGMFLAAGLRSPIRRLVMNDIGPLIPGAFLGRLAAYVGKPVRFDTLEQGEAYLREIHAPFGTLTDAQWRHLADHSLQHMRGGYYILGYDPKIGDAFRAQGDPQDVALWEAWARVDAPVLAVRGARSDLLSAETVAQMKRTHRSGRVAEFVVADAGHAPALMDDGQIAAVEAWLAGREVGVAR